MDFIWFPIVMAAIIIIYKLDDLIKVYKNSNKSESEMNESYLQQEHERLEIINELNSLIGEKCCIKSEGLIYMSPSKDEATCTILNVDETFVELEFLKRKKKINLIYKIENIESISRVIE